MPTAWLKLPHYPQSHEGLCLPACARMVLATWERNTTEQALSELLGSTPMGTPSSRIQRLSLWGYQVIYRTATLAELKSWLTQGIPIIAFVRTQFLTYWHEDTPHAVVIVGIGDNEVYLHDPAFTVAPQITLLDGFLAAWIEQDEVVAVIQPA